MDIVQKGKKQMEIKMKLSEIQALSLPRKGNQGESIPSLIDFILNAPIKEKEMKASYWLTRIMNKIISQVSDLNKQRDKLIKEYLIDAPLPKDAKEGTKPNKMIDQTRADEMNKKWDDLLALEITLDLNSKIKIEWLEGMGLSNGDLILLEKIMEVDESKMK